MDGISLTCFEGSQGYSSGTSRLNLHIYVRVYLLYLPEHVPKAVFYVLTAVCPLPCEAVPLTDYPFFPCSMLRQPGIKNYSILVNDGIFDSDIHLLRHQAADPFVRPTNRPLACYRPPCRGILLLVTIQLCP